MKRFILSFVVLLPLLSAAHAAQESYELQLRRHIDGYWTKPSGDSFKCDMRIRLDRIGNVLEALPQGCTIAIGESLRRAIQKASPLPTPVDPGQFKPELTLSFDPLLVIPRPVREKTDEQGPLQLLGPSAKSASFIMAQVAGTDRGWGSRSYEVREAEINGYLQESRVNTHFLKVLDDIDPSKRSYYVERVVNGQSRGVVLSRQGLMTWSYNPGIGIRRAPFDLWGENLWTACSWPDESTFILRFPQDDLYYYGSVQDARYEDREVFAIERMRKDGHARHSQWQILLVDRSSYLVLAILHYKESHAQSPSQNVRIEYKQYDGKWQVPVRMTLFNGSVGSKDKRCDVTFGNYRFQTGMTDQDFTVETFKSLMPSRQ